jgi:hypothetical protein
MHRSVSHSFLDPQSPLVSDEAVKADPLCQVYTCLIYYQH